MVKERGSAGTGHGAAQASLSKSSFVMHLSSQHNSFNDTHKSDYHSSSFYPSSPVSDTIRERGKNNIAFREGKKTKSHLLHLRSPSLSGSDLIPVEEQT